ncbi:MAG: transposase [Pseudomonadota bacterium]
MSAYLRPKIPGACIFFTVALANRGTTTLVDQIDLLRDAVRQARRERPFEINAWVVLPDHLHAVWTLPEGDADYAVRWGAIKSRFTRRLRDRRRPGFSPADVPDDLPVVQSGRYAGLKPGLRKGKREQAVWQRRFYDRHIRNDEEFSAAVRYCHLNPVKHGFVERAEDWPYSSVHRELAAGRWVA